MDDMEWTDDPRRNLERWLAWHDPEAVGLGIVEPPRKIFQDQPTRPPWANPEFGDRPAYGFFSDREWARTVWPNPRYL
jgi:hypothetical protein